jgi:hypothetical protein
LISGAGEPTGWRKLLLDFNDVLPTHAGGVITQATATPGALLGPWSGLAVLGVWTVVCLIVACVATTRRNL